MLRSTVDFTAKIRSGRKSLRGAGWVLALCLSMVANVSWAALSQTTYRVLQKAQGAAQQEQLAEAYGLLNDYLKERQDDLSPADLAYLNQNAGYYASQLSRDAAALHHFQAAFDNPELPAESRQHLRLNLAQLHAQMGQPKRVVALLAPWFASGENPYAQGYLVLGRAYAEIGQPAQSIAPIQAAISLEKKPEASWFQWLAAACYDAGRLDQAAAALKSMLVLYPEQAAGWRQYTAILLQQERFDAAIAAIESARYLGHLRGADEVKRLAQLYRYRQTPRKAAVLLETSLKDGVLPRNEENLKQLAQVWMQARDSAQALPVYQEWAQQSADGSAAYDWASLLMQEQRWGDAVEALQLALRKGGVKDPGRVWLLMGYAYVEMKKTPAAREAMAKAADYRSTQQSAQRWLASLDS